MVCSYYLGLSFVSYSCPATAVLVSSSCVPNSVSILCPILMSWVVFHIRGSVSYPVKLCCRQRRKSKICFIMFGGGSWGESGWGVGLLFYLLSCVDEGVQFDTCCLLDFLSHWYHYGISQTSISATAGLRDEKRHPCQDIGHEMKLELPGCWGSLNCALPLKW